MQRKTRRTLSSWILVATLAMSSSVIFVGDVSAQQPAGDKSAEQETTRKVVELIRAAKALQKEGKNADALAKYEEAYALKPLPALLYPMGQTAAASGQNAKAIEYYEKFVKALPNEDAAQRVASEDLPKLRAMMPAKLKVTSTPEGAKVFLNDPQSASVGVTPYEGEVEPGKTTVILQKEGFQKFSEEVTLEGMGEGAVDAKLEPAQLTDVTEPEEPEEKTSGGPLRAVGFGVTGVGVALLATGGTFSVLSMNRTNQVNDYDKASAPSGPTGRAEIEDLKDQANSFYRGALVSYIAGGVITAVGVGTLAYGMARGGSEEAEAESATRTRLQFGVGRQGAFFGLQRTF